MHELEEQWSFQEADEAHMILDAIEEAEADAREQASRPTAASLLAGRR